jgi:GxxExxY protein
VPFEYDGHTFDDGFRADLIVDDSVLIELKSVEHALPVHKEQALTYLKLSGLKLGFLINFGAPIIKDGIVRLANGMPDVTS